MMQGHIGKYVVDFLVAYRELLRPTLPILDAG
jgi:hypothetical protein